MTKPDKTTEESAVKLDDKELDEAQGGSDPENRFRVKVKYVNLGLSADAAKNGLTSD